MKLYKHAVHLVKNISYQQNIKKKIQYWIILFPKIGSKDGTIIIIANILKLKK